MPTVESPKSINGVSLLTQTGKPKSRYSDTDRLRILGATQGDLNATIRLFCPGRPLYAATHRQSDDPRSWTTPRGRLSDSDVLRHLTGNLTPGLNPRWVAPHSWEATRWVGIDVDFRGDRKDFHHRCRKVLQALAQLGIPNTAILKNLTPSGGRHYRFFTTRRIRVSDIPQVLGLVGLHESPGQIELFPKRNKGMRLPFGYIPERIHDPRQWLRFIRAFRRGTFPKVNWIECLNRASEFARNDAVSKGGSKCWNDATPTNPASEVQSRRTTRVSTLGVPNARKMRDERLGSNARDRYRELVSRPVSGPGEATELWNLGICEVGTRVEATKRMAWHLLFARNLSAQGTADLLVDWVYTTGHETSADVQNDQLRATRKVEEQTRQIVHWMACNHIATPVAREDLSRFSPDELVAIRQKLGEGVADATLVSAALSILRFAKLHGAPQLQGWLAQIAVNGVIRKWPGCGGMKYKPILEALTKCGLIAMAREKRQSANGTGRPRTYLIQVQPELRTGASLSHEEAVKEIEELVEGRPIGQIPASSSERVLNTYKRSIPQTSTEELGKIKREVGQVENSFHQRDKTSDSTPLDVGAFFRQAESARFQSLIGDDTGLASARPLWLLHEKVNFTPETHGPVDHSYGGVGNVLIRSCPARSHRTYRHQHRHDLEPTAVLDQPASTCRPGT